MAKKVVQTDNIVASGKGTTKTQNGKAPVKKKKHGCRNCFITILVFILVIGVAGYFTADFFTRKYIDMSLSSCFGVLRDLRSVKPSKIVTNGYGDNDYKRFNTELKQQLFLKSDVDFGSDKLIASIIDNIQEDGEEGGETENSDSESLLARSAGALGAGLDTSGFLSELTELYVRENMDAERLAGYNAAEHSDYVMHISDKMLASAVNKAINSVGKLDAISEMLDEFNVEKLSDIASVEQIIFGEHKGVKDGAETDVKAFTATLSVNLRAVANSLLKEKTGKDLSFVSKLFLPKRFYITVVVPLETGASIENAVYLNNMSDAKMNRAYKLIDNVTAAAGSKLNAKEKISGAILDSMGEVTENVNEVFPLSEAQNGVVEFDVFQKVIELGKINEENGEVKPEEKRLKASDIIGTLSGLVASNPDNAIKEQYDYSHQYFDSTADKVVYIKTENPGDAVAGMQWLDYKELFMRELSEKYMLDLTMGTPDLSDDVTFDDLMHLFGLGDPLSEPKELELLDLFDSSKLNGIFEQENKKVNVDSRMLGAILQTQINNLISSGGSLGSCNPKLEYVYTYLTSENHVTHNMLEAAISVDVRSLLPKDAGVSSMVAGLVGDSAVVTFNVDVTPNTDENFKYLDSSLSYNGLNKEKTELVLKTVSAFVSDFNTEKLLEQVETPMRDTIGKMNDVISIKLCSSEIDLDATPSELPPAIQLSDVFETVKNMLFKDDENITAQGIENVLKSIDAVNGTNFEQEYLKNVSLSADYKSSLEELTRKYYIKGNYETFDSLFGDAGILSPDKFDSDKFELERMYHDPSSEESLRPLFTDGDIAALVLEKMKSETDSGSELYTHLLKVKGVRIIGGESEPTLTAVFELDSSSLVDSNNADELRLLPADKIYLRATVKLSSVGYYNQSNGEEYFGEEEPDASYTPFFRTDITLNDMDAETYITAVNMLNSLNKNKDENSAKAVDFEVVARDIGAVVYGRISAMQNSLGSDTEFVDGGVRLASVYGYMRTSLLSENSAASAADVKAAVQGLVAKNNVLSENSEHNYDAEKIIENPLNNAVNFKFENGKISMTDRSFGRGLAGGFNVDLGGGISYTAPAVLGDGNGYSLTQLNILSGSLGNREEFLQGFGKTLNGAGTYLELTFTLELRQIGTGDFKNALPENVNVTVLFSKSAGGYEFEYFRINELNETRQNILFELAGIDVSKYVETQIAKCETALAAYSGAELRSLSSAPSGAYPEGGKGYIEFLPQA